MWSKSVCEDLLTEVRTRQPGDGLLALGRFAFGQPGYLTQGGLALRKQGDSTGAFLNGNGQRLLPTDKTVTDRALAELGLELVHVNGPATPLNHRAVTGGLIWRAGVLLRLLDQSFAHLSGRESGGQKTLQHQLVKATFTECFALAEQIRLETPHYLDGVMHLDHQDQHNKLNAATTKAAKLMGGHGYLLGSLNSLETLSFCGAALLSNSDKHQTRVAA